jgi:hypothetical protein
MPPYYVFVYPYKHSLQIMRERLDRPSRLTDGYDSKSIITGLLRAVKQKLRLCTTDRNNGHITLFEIRPWQHSSWILCAKLDRLFACPTTYI